MLFIKKYCNFEACFYATGKGEVLGIAGIQDRKNNFNKSPGLKDLVRNFNLFRAFIIKQVYRYKHSVIPKDTTRLDGLAVAEKFS